jgi:hypothetical protein
VLTVGTREISSAFQLLGVDENSATFALGWILENCSAYRQRLIKNIFNRDIIIDEPFIINLQKHADDGGYTDLEIKLISNIILLLNQSVLGNFLLLDSCNATYQDYLMSSRVRSD